ncbi:hypothetical protein A0H81_10121 [Grifola frondosa]|uniref:Uncharacterized protein n=1 Tax=Grifola frondosa TaxID=5627 RepID=A0A1C7LYF4_GRIFR|nr:hypothetical protein A0H81_10121 [Grifola frondosa]
MVFALAFVLGRVLKREYDSLRHAAQTASTSTSTTAGWVDSFQVTVQLDLVDTAPDKAHDHPGDNGVKYQKSQRITGPWSSSYLTTSSSAGNLLSWWTMRSITKPNARPRSRVCLALVLSCALSSKTATGSPWSWHRSGRLFLSALHVL